MQEVWAQSTRDAYSFGWNFFTTWRRAHQVYLYSATGQDILMSLQSQIEAERSALTQQGMASTIKAVWVGDHALDQDSCFWIFWFLRGAQRLTVHKTRSFLPPWDLDIFLGGLQHSHFELRRGSNLK